MARDISFNPGRTETASPKSVSELSGAEARLVTLMRQIGFGRIEHVRITNGEPTLDENARIVTDVKLGCNEIHRRSQLEDFALKHEVCEFVAVIRSLGSAVIRKVEVRHGLPAHLQVEQPVDDMGGSR